MRSRAAVPGLAGPDPDRRRQGPDVGGARPSSPSWASPTASWRSASPRARTARPAASASSPHGKPSFTLPVRDPVLYFVQRLRDEAHRFAIGSHRARRKKEMAKNPLDEIGGIGPTRKRALLTAFRHRQGGAPRGHGRSDGGGRHLRDRWRASSTIIFTKIGVSPQICPIHRLGPVDPQPRASDLQYGEANRAEKHGQARIQPAQHADLRPAFWRFRWSCCASFSKGGSSRATSRAGRRWSIFIVASVTDYLDGYLARAWQQTSNIGRMLDPIADKLLVATCLLLLAADTDRTIAGWSLWAAIIILCREILVSGLREYLAELKVSVPVTQLAKWKTDDPDGRHRLPAGSARRWTRSCPTRRRPASCCSGLPRS